ncbi:F420-dependent hydroxymycolic acid dehydrogenase [Rhodococcus sp. B50]|nr:F420-dependent hydroxymycolic acid dehydrogenase [Rhodococcus sp. B50]
MLFGIGVGWLQEEFAAFEIPFRTRYSRTEECIEILRQAWSGTEFSHTGKRFTFDTVQVHPRPTPIPIVLAGNTPKALARAARLGDAWFSSGTPTLDESTSYVQQLSALRAQTGRPDEFRCYVRVADPPPTNSSDTETAG